MDGTMTEDQLKDNLSNLNTFLLPASRQELIAIILRQEKEILYLMQDNERLVKGTNDMIDAIELNPMALSAHKVIGH